MNGLERYAILGTVELLKFLKLLIINCKVRTIQ